MTHIRGSRSAWGRRGRENEGAVLILVLGVVAILAALAVELAARSKARVHFAARTARDDSFSRLFDSGAALARGLLSEPEAEIYDYWGDPWNEEVRFTLLPGESAVVRVSDESGKINIARAITHPDERPRIRRMLGRLFEYLAKVSPANLGRWEDLRERVLGRLGLGPKAAGPAGARPEPLFTLDGLREAGLEISEVFGREGLSRYLTSFGDGKINLNSAPRAVLYALGEDFTFPVVERIARYRGRGEGEKGTYTPFTGPQDLERVDGIVERVFEERGPRVIRNLYAQVQGLVTTQSSSFAARIEAKTQGGRRREAWVFFEPRRIARNGEPSRREVRTLVLEEILP